MDAPAAAHGYEVTPAALAEAARGIEDVLAGLRSLGVGVGRAEAGRGVAAVALGTGPVGHDGLARAFATFCSRWEWGVRDVVRTGREIAAGLGDTALGYQDTEHAQGGLFQRIVSDVTGDPTPAPAPDGPDPSWSRTGASMADTWSATAADVAGSSVPGMVARVLRGDDPLRGPRGDLAELHTIVE